MVVDLAEDHVRVVCSSDVGGDVQGGRERDVEAGALCAGAALGGRGEKSKG